MKMWQWVTLCIICFDLGCVFGIWWKGFVDNDDDFPAEKEIPADSAYGRTVNHLMEGK